MLIALISVPIMLLPKPLVLRKRFNERARQLESYGRISPHDDDEEAGTLHVAAPAHEHEEEFDFSEVMVHQVKPAGRHQKFKCQFAKSQGVHPMDCNDWWCSVLPSLVHGNEYL